MANGKQYVEVFNDGHDDLYIRDIEAQENLARLPLVYATKAELTSATIIPIEIDDLTPTTTFVKNNIIGINGVMYRALKNTSEFPVVVLVEDGHIVYDEDEHGRKSFVVDDYTLSEDWEIWTDASIPRALELMASQQSVFVEQQTAQQSAFIAQQTAAFETEQQVMENFRLEIRLAVAGAIKESEVITASSGQTYTVRQILQTMAELMDKTVVVNEETQQE